MIIILPEVKDGLIGDIPGDLWKCELRGGGVAGIKQARL